MILPRPFYILYRIGEMLVSLGSRAIHAIFYGGSTYQTLSARSHVEVILLGNKEWERERKFINALFFWQKDHCEWAWLKSVEEAKKTLQRAKVVL